MTPLERVVATLLDPVGVDGFRRHVFGRRLLHSGPSAERLAALRGLTSWTLEDLLAARRTNATAWFETTTDRHATAEVSPAAARRLYAGGLTIYLREVEQLTPLAGAIAGALVVPVQNVMCSVYCNQPAAATQVHFDPVDTITVQIAGSKTWRVAPNEHAPDPTSTWIPNERNPSPELAQYTQTPMPTAMPAAAGTYTLTPGSMLYIPRGHWHDTRSDEESVSLHVHYITTSWIDVLLDTLRARLLREASLRRSADDLWDPRRRDTMLTDAVSALATLTSAVRDLSPDDVVPTPPPNATDIAPERPLVRRATAGLRAEELPDSPDRFLTTVVVGEQGSHRETTIKLPAVHLQACRLLAGATARRPLSPAAVAAEVPGLGVDGAVELARLLVEAGYLRAAAEPGVEAARRRAA